MIAADLVTGMLHVAQNDLVSLMRDVSQIIGQVTYDRLHFLFFIFWQKHLHICCARVYGRVSDRHTQTICACVLTRHPVREVSDLDMSAV